MATTRDNSQTKDTNPDPITGAPGSHPVGTGVGAAATGAAGAAIGSVAGPVGTAVGAVVGAVAGGLAGKDAAEGINPTTEDAYWRQNYKTRPYASSTSSYDEYAPAYRYGWESRSRYSGKNFDDIEPDLRKNWAASRGTCRLDWDKARPAVRDAWQHVSQPSAAATTAQGGAAVPVVEEQIDVGKRQVLQGGVRVKTHVEEKPVEKDVTLREETVRVERRPADRPASEADFAKAREGTLDVTETREVPVVNKQAHVVEEVVIGKDVKQHTETVRDTVRRTDVDVEKIDNPDSASKSTGQRNSTKR